MRSSDAQDDLVVSTPERVAFQYAVAGPGSRFLAQLIDFLVLGLLLAAMTVASIAVGTAFNNSQLAVLFWVVLSFLLVFGYFLVSEAVWSGQTLGKRALRLRVVGDRGEPITLMQSVIRNLVRVVDFFPGLYGIGLIALFINGRGKRLGDLAAGTLVVRERQRVSLYDLAGTPPPAPSAPPSAASIWSSPAEPAAPPGTVVPPAPAGPSPAPARPLEPGLRRLVVAYAARRHELALTRRQAIARNAEPALRRALPDVVAGSGPLAALDQLAETEGISPTRPVDRRASWALGLGITSLVSALVLFFFPVVGLGFGIASIVVGTKALRRIRSAPHRLQGEDRAKTGRVVGIIGTAISGLLVLIVGLGVLFSR